jgi:short-subunit dehydrogenase
MTSVLEGCNAVVTGGASGLGRELCFLLAERNASLLIADLNLEIAKETATEAVSRGACKAKAFYCDVRACSDVNQLALEAEHYLGTVDLFVNNVGAAQASSFEAISLEDWRWSFDTNLWSVIHGCRAFLPGMMQHGGRILNIASAAGFLNPPQMAAYNVTKAGVIALSETLFAEYRCQGIYFTVACPLFFKSKMVENGRIRDPEFLEKARKLVTYSPISAKSVAEKCIKAVEQGKLRVVPSFTARLVWILKRLAPSVYSNLLAYVYAKKTKGKASVLVSDDDIR